MIDKKPISAQQNNWFDSQNVDDENLNLEQTYNTQIQSSIINNHFGTGLLQDSLVQQILFDSALISGLLDGKAISAQSDPSDLNLGNQLEIELTNSNAFGKKAVKLAIIGLDFQGNLQYDTFLFYKNEKQITKKHYTKLLTILFNDFIGPSAQSFNLGGRVIIKEAAKLFMSRDSIMVAQDLQPNLFWRDFYITESLTLSGLLTTALPNYNVDSLDIFTGYKQLRTIGESDVVSHIGQKFLAQTNNIQKITLLLSVTNGTGKPPITISPWTGDLVISIYPLQSAVSCQSDITPQLAIDFDPSNIPLAQLSVNYNTLLANGIILDSVPQPIDFVFSNTLVANGSSIISGNYYAITIKRSGAADNGIIQTPVGNNILDNAMVSLFDGTSWIDVPEEDLWFQVWTDSAKITDGQFYDSGNGASIVKTQFDITSGFDKDFSIDHISFVRNDQYFGFLQAITNENTPIQDERTGNPVFSKKQFIPAFSLIKDTDVANFEKTFYPLLNGIIVDKNKKSVDPISSATIDFNLYSFSICKNEILIKIIDDITDPRYDQNITTLVSKFLNGSLNHAKFIPNTNKLGIYYKVGSAELLTMKYGDVNGDGIIDESDLIEAENLLNYNINIAPTSAAIYNNLINLFVPDSHLTFNTIQVSALDPLITGTDGAVIPINDSTQCNFISAGSDFTDPSVYPQIIGKTINIVSGNAGNNGIFQIIGVIDLHTLLLEKQYYSTNNFLKLFRSDINGDDQITSQDIELLSSYINKESPFPPTTPPANKIGSNFNVLKISLELFQDRGDDYTTATATTRNSLLHTLQDIFLNDVAVGGSGFAGTNLLTNPIPASSTSGLYWDDFGIACDSSIKSVETVFTTNDGLIINKNIVGVNEVDFPLQPSFDSGRNDIFVPNNLIIGFGGELERPDGYFYKVDYEVKNIVFEIPAISFDSEKRINIFTDFIVNYTDDGFTRLGYESAKFADGSYVSLKALENNQVLFDVSVQSFSPNLDGYDISLLSGAVVDGKIGVFMDNNSGLLYLNFTNLYQDAVLQTLSTKIQVSVLLKKAGFNNKPIFFDSVKMTNLLGLSGLPSVGGSGGIVNIVANIEELPIFAGSLNTSSTSFSTIGALYFDPNNYVNISTRSIKLRTVGIVSNNLVTEGQILLTTSSDITIASYTFNHSSFTSDTSIELNSLITVADVYKVKIKVSSIDGGNITIYNAVLQVSWE